MRTFPCVVTFLLFPLLFLAPAITGAEEGARTLLGDPWRYERPPGLRYGAPIDTGTYQYGNPTAAEQAHLERINRARLDPQAEADRLLGGNLNEGITDHSDFISTASKQPLAFNARLYQAARLHSQDMIAQDYFAHTSKDGRSPWDRIADAGYAPLQYGAENIAGTYAPVPIDEAGTILAMHDQFVVDSGVTGRGHRINIFNDNLKEIGIGAATGSFVYNGIAYNYTWMLTCDFGTLASGNPFVLGVVYNDKNRDGQYTAGEGLGVVDISILRPSDAGTAATTTASAGGYGIPLPPGTYEVTATLSDGRSVKKTAVVSDRNVKIDFRSSDFPIPGDVDGNGRVDLADAVMALRIVAGVSATPSPPPTASLAGNGKIGLAEAIYALQKAAGAR